MDCIIERHVVTNLDAENISKKYRKEEKLGEGTYAVVYRGIQLGDKAEKEEGRVVAIKKIKFGLYKDGMDMSAIREIKFLQEIRHPNVIQLFDVYSIKGNIFLVLEYLEGDLELIIKDKNLLFMPGDIKSWMVMMLRGLEHCHRCWVLHRDMKPNNLLIDRNGILKLADFGLARSFGDPLGTMTSQVVTRHLMKLLFGAKEYGSGVDMWAAGCIFAELMLRAPYLPGESDLDQLNTIFRALGTPTESDWPGMTKLPDYVEYKKHPRTPFRQIFTAASDDALDLLQKMLVFDPHKRILAKNALKHRYFSNHPFATAPEKLPKRTPAGDEGSKGKKRKHESDS